MVDLECAFLNEAREINMIVKLIVGGGYLILNALFTIQIKQIRIINITHRYFFLFYASCSFK